MPSKENPFAIIGFEAKELFGYIDQKLEARAEDVDVISRLMVLYGENGTGKTTLLRIAFHLLSPYTDRGHKTKILNMPFKHISVTLRDGSKISADRKSSMKGKFTFTVKVPGKKAMSQQFVPFEAKDLPDDIQPYEFIPQTEKAIIERSSNVLFLRDDRSFDIEEVGSESELYLSPRGKRKKPTRFRQVVIGPRGENVELYPENETASVTRALNVAIRRLEGWFNVQYSKETSTGMASTHAIYQEVIEKLSQSDRKKSSKKLPIQKSIKILEKLAEESEVFDKYGISARIDPTPMIKSIIKASRSHEKHIGPLLDTYLRAVEVRFELLRGLYRTIDTFITKMNGFFAPKKVTYTLSDGLKIFTPKGTRIRPDHLSSGERQLLLILTTAVLTREYRTLFMIDEPEISLNTTWQRQLVPALLEISSESNSQFIMASHSISMSQSCPEHVLRLSPGDFEE